MNTCDNCGWEGIDEAMANRFPDIPGLEQRLDPGGVVPSGECPECGALCYGSGISPSEKKVADRID
jgi:predicted RNA-binding Zn-ribbon protein involved in translation (DUF1610 family)